MAGVFQAQMFNCTRSTSGLANASTTTRRNSGAANPRPHARAAIATRESSALLPQESVTLRIDQDVLEHFQQDGPGSQERVNAALRKAAGK
jgi:uncharacterized protein (DUF4415 family)